MKKEILIAFCSLALIIGCKKSEDGNKGIISESESTQTKITDENGKIDSTTTTSIEKNIDGRKMDTESIPYKAEDGSRAKATFVNTDKSSTIMIEANNKKFQLDRKTLTSEGAVYERKGISAEVKGDSLFITQDNNVIHLRKVK